MKLVEATDLAPAFDVAFEALLAPVTGGDREARHHDEATLPMGERERPLIKADWKAVAAMCSGALGSRSKDFQLAAWICEAWTHLHRMEGFVAGTHLLAVLVERYRDQAWPRIEDGDADTRIASFVWMNDAFSLLLSLHVPLMAIEGREPSTVNLDD